MANSLVHPLFSLSMVYIDYTCYMEVLVKSMTAWIIQLTGYNPATATGNQGGWIKEPPLYLVSHSTLYHHPTLAWESPDPCSFCFSLASTIFVRLTSMEFRTFNISGSSAEKRVESSGGPIND